MDSRDRAPGVNIGLGTDTRPPDLLRNLQNRLYVARVMEGDAKHTSTADLYNAATLGGAKALGRDDIGRLAPGAQADMVVFDLQGEHLGTLFDPFKNLILAGRDGLPGKLCGRQMRDGGLCGGGGGCGGATGAGVAAV